MNSPSCGVMQKASKVHCSLQKDHEGSHMHVSPSGTTVWGFAYATATRGENA